MDDATDQKDQPARFLTTGEVAAALDMSRQSVLRWAVAGVIPGWKTPGGQWRFSPADVPAMMRKADEARAVA